MRQSSCCGEEEEEDVRRVGVVVIAVRMATAAEGVDASEPLSCGSLLERARSAAFFSCCTRLSPSARGLCSSPLVLVFSEDRRRVLRVVLLSL
jgi:hypothetical protein